LRGVTPPLADQAVPVARRSRHCLGLKGPGRQDQARIISAVQ